MQLSDPATLKCLSLSSTHKRFLYNLNSIKIIQCENQLLGRVLFVNIINKNFYKRDQNIV